MHYDDIVTLGHYKVIAQIETDGRQQSVVETTQSPISCFHCQSTSIARWGAREQLIKDFAPDGQLVSILVMVKRFRCSSCGKTFSQTLPLISEKRAMTERLVHWIEQQALCNPFTAIAERVGVTEGTIRNIFRDYVRCQESSRVVLPQSYLALGELFIEKKNRCVIFSAVNGRIIDVVDNSEIAITDALSAIGGNSIRAITISMSEQQRKAVQATLPSKPLAINVTALLTLADQALERLRVHVRSTLTDKQKRMLAGDRLLLQKRRFELGDQDYELLDTLKDDYPSLFAGYQAKEGIYERLSSIDATQVMAGGPNAFQRLVAPNIRPFFDVVIEAIDSWWPQVLTYLSLPEIKTFDLTPSLPKSADLGRKQSFEVVRAKLIFGPCS
ncbi:transposase [Aeromonas veronii]|uniref:ISL3 family transposase n=1 Tax=Aeromonas veronii TaxID=654 RepID=A0A4S5CP61_AERVE|nr:transposase [Aeromonas veronii]THJ44976.1 ISL3 family transposase [Aeromonas veronii]